MKTGTEQKTGRTANHEGTIMERMEAMGGGHLSDEAQELYSTTVAAAKRLITDQDNLAKVIADHDRMDCVRMTCEAQVRGVINGLEAYTTIFGLLTLPMSC